MKPIVLAQVTTFTDSAYSFVEKTPPCDVQQGARRSYGTTNKKCADESKPPGVSNGVGNDTYHSGRAYTLNICGQRSHVRDRQGHDSEETRSQGRQLSLR